MILLVISYTPYYRLVTEFDEGGSLEVNQPGCYSTVCVELSIDAVATNAVFQVSGCNYIVDLFQGIFEQSCF